MYEIKKYPDGSSYCKGVAPFVITHKVNSYEDLWHLQQILDAADGRGIKVVIPWLIDSQADRKFNSNESSGLRLVCRFLNMLHDQYDCTFEVFHPHNPEALEAYMGTKYLTIKDNSIFISKVLENVDIENLVLMSSDAGGFKPLMKLCDSIDWTGETHSAAKARSWDEVDGAKFIQKLGTEDFGGKDVMIVDDCSVYGGTFKGLSKLLDEANVGKKYLAVSHMTVQSLGKDPVTNYFNKVYTTNSKFDKLYVPHFSTPLNTKKSGVRYPDNLEIIKLFDFI